MKTKYYKLLALLAASPLLMHAQNRPDATLTERSSTPPSSVTGANNDGSSVMDAYSVIDASVSVNLPYDMSLELGARNLLDAEYSAWPQLNGVYGNFYFWI